MKLVKLLGGSADGKTVEVAADAMSVRVPVLPGPPSLRESNPTASANGPRIEEYAVSGRVAVAPHYRLCEGCETEIIRQPDECEQCAGSDPYGGAFCPNCDYCCGC